MAMSLLTPPETGSDHEAPRLHTGDAPRWSEMPEEGVFASLVSSVRDVFFPEKLPPLELQSQAIPVVDRMAVKRSPTSTAIAVAIHVVIIAFIAWLVAKGVKMASSIPQIGVPNSPLVGMSMGNGSGTGLGSGNGSGIGPGSGGNIGGGVRRIGGGVSAPQLIFQVEPEFSEEARKAKVAGNVLVTLIVDAAGHPQRVRVLRGIGMGLDEKAVEAVRQYRFKPAMEGGKPVPVEVNIDVNFQIF